MPNRNSKSAILLRETYREDGKVKNRTLANLSQWSPEKLAALARELGEVGVTALGEALDLGPVKVEELYKAMVKAG